MKDALGDVQSVLVLGGTSDIGVATAKALVERRARTELSEMSEGRTPAHTIALLLSSGRPLPQLEKILDSHALIHSAEGEFYREALKAAGEALRLRVVGLREKEIFELAAKHLKLRPAAIKARLESFKRSVGPPWTADEKLATLVAWMQLGSRGVAAKQ